MDGSDLVHEYLHLFLIALKYSDSDVTYEELLLNYKENNPERVGDTNNLNEIEEAFVYDVTYVMNEDENIYVDEEQFSRAFQEALSVLSIPTETFDMLGVYGLLNLSIWEIFEEDLGAPTSEVANSSLAHFEGSFRF